uniref:Uncharacterized protein n=1 Tax=Ulva partita TaxID=1605170 RepID=A0A1C9ZWD8_9CHLO|nr:hypothetical protein [Ulva partita]
MSEGGRWRVCDRGRLCMLDRRVLGRWRGHTERPVLDTRRSEVLSSCSRYISSNNGACSLPTNPLMYKISPELKHERDSMVSPCGASIRI